MRPRADTLLAWTGAPCSYGCPTCPIDAATAPLGLQAADLHRDLAAVPAREGRLVVLVGGEPFLRPDLFRLLAAIRGAGCVPGMITTGRPLVYPQLRDKLRRAGLAYLRVQFFGSGDAHDRATGVPGAFEQALTGLRAWIAEAGAECDVDAALSIRRRSLATLTAEAEELTREIASPQVRIVIASDPATATEAQSIESLPQAASTEPAQLAFVGTIPRACCLGAVNERDGAATAGPCANSFNYVRSATAFPCAATADACSAHQAAHGVDPQRQVWLVEGDDVVLYVTDTGDFDRGAIARIKDEWSHLFLDRAPAGVLDDFTQGMQRVLPDPICDPCRHRARCGRRFRTTEGPPFAREEAWIASYVANLRGRVLDVGCGEQLYRDALAPLLRSGAIQYTGLDPDEISLNSLRAALPAGQFHVGGIEDFHGEPASYDHVLCLRSLNHVVDLDQAMARMTAFLNPGGQLLIVETTPFAMLRRPEQVAAADHAPRAGHQHFRNVASEDILPLARQHALRVLKHHPASLHNTNEWILLLARA